MLSQHGDDRVDISAFERIDKSVHQIANALVAEQSQGGLLAVLGEPVTDRFAGALQSAVDGGRGGIQRLGQG